MPKNIYELLEIEPTDDMTIVKKAYYKMAMKVHPDKNPGQAKETNEQFQALIGAYERVNEETKLKEYYAAYLSNNLENFNSSIKNKQSKAMPTRADMPQHNKSTTSVSVPKLGMIDIYIPIELDLDFVNSRKIHKNMPPEAFDNNFNFDLLAGALTEKSSRKMLQVGATFDEAKAITNLHSHRSLSLIAKVTVPMTRLSDSRISERELHPTSLSATTKHYFCLVQNSKITANDIISVRALTPDEHENTRRVNVDRMTNEYWLKDHTVHNPMNHLLEYTSTRNTLFKPATNPLSSDPLEETEEKNSSLSVSQIKKINLLIESLQREIKSHWPYPNKELKQEKVDALTELKQLCVCHSIEDSIISIQEKFKRVMEGKISTRTADLIDSLKSESSLKKTN